MANLTEAVQAALKNGSRVPANFPEVMRPLFIARYPSEMIISSPLVAEQLPVPPQIAELDVGVTSVPMVQIVGRWKMPGDTAEKFFATTHSQAQWDYLVAAPEGDETVTTWAADVAAALKIYTPE